MMLSESNLESVQQSNWCIIKDVSQSMENKYNLNKKNSEKYAFIEKYPKSDLQGSWVYFGMIRIWNPT